MPRVMIDNQTIEVAKGTKVIQAAEMLGIYIPRFCYHEALGSAGACRMCAVMFLEGPVKGLEMSCMVEAADGMVVSTNHPEAQRFRRCVIEWLMLNHPHDCPACDEGGACLLQDMTVSSGHGIRRYHGPKLTFTDQELGPFVSHEANRCINCWRCRRFYQEYAGYRDLGALGIGQRTYFGRQKSGRLQSPFAGNLIDLCPTGAFTDKPSRFQGRHWDFERADSICPHCSLGCATTVNLHYRQVVRLEARPAPEVNGHFICDRGRYGFDFANHPQRPRRAHLAGRKTDTAKALEAAAAGLGKIVAEHGSGAVAALGSCRMSLEAQVALQRLNLEQGWSGARFFPEPDLALRVQAAARGLEPDLALSLTQLAQADFILSVGVSPLPEAPMLMLAMRQAWRNGSTVALLDPRPLELSFPGQHLPLACEALEIGLPWLIKQSFRAKQRKELEKLHPALLAPADMPGLTKKELRELKKLARMLAKSRRPALVCGTDLVPQDLPARTAGLARLLREQGKEAGLFFVLPGANALGAVFAAPEEARAGNLLEGMEQGRIKALVAVESDPLFACADRLRMEQALESLELLIVLDHLPSPLVDKAGIFIPTTNLYEAQGASLLNQEGRLQLASPAQAGGTPLSQLGDGGHPPRLFFPATPGGEPRPAADILAGLGRLLAAAGRPGSVPDVWEWLAQRQPAMAEALSQGGPLHGQRLLPIHTVEGALGKEFAAALPGEQELELMVSPQFFHGDEMACYSSILAEAGREAALWLHPKTAKQLGLEANGRARLRTGQDDLVLRVLIADDMNLRTVVLTGDAATPWQQLRGRREVLPISAFEAVKGGS